jgi:two-component system, OmpR family, sensor kinase
VAEPLEHRAEAIGESVWALVIPLFLLIPLTSFLVIWAVRKALLPIRLLNQDIRKRGKENLDEFDSSKQPEELLPMITSLNGLMKRIGFAIGAEREFASNSAHELRTPIAATLAQVQRLIVLNENPEIHRRALEIEGGLNRLKRLSEKLLQLSRADASALRKGEVTNVHMVFQHIVEELSHGEPDNLPLKFDAENLSSLNWPLDIDGVAIILRNLVENAMRYRLEDSKIEIFCDQDNGLHVVNDCKALEKEKVERLTQRFERGHNHEGGAGLGLAIVDTFVQHGAGKLSIFSPAIDKESGFEIVVKF